MFDSLTECMCVDCATGCGVSGRWSVSGLTESIWVEVSIFGRESGGGVETVAVGLGGSISEVFSCVDGDGLPDLLDRVRRPLR